MLLKQKYIEFRAKLADDKNYQTVPHADRKRILHILDALLTFDGEEFLIRAESFDAGIIRFIDDIGESRCADMLADMPDCDD